jgi:serine protease AprX
MGPTADNRIKPDVAAMGVATSVIEPSGSVGKSSGTSLAAPLITSLVAGVWQRYPELTNREVMDAIRSSGSQAANPDKYLGFGIPSYDDVVAYLDHRANSDLFSVFPNPAFHDSIAIKPLFPDEVSSCKIEFISVEGRIIMEKQVSFSRAAPVFTQSLFGFRQGSYFARITWDDKTFVYRFVKY